MFLDQTSFNRAALRLLAGFTACLALGGCGNSMPSGQVIARVDGEDVTVPEFEFETGRQPAADDIALIEAITRRKALAKIAQERGLEQEPQYHFEVRRAREELLVDALYRQLESVTPAPSRTQIIDYIASHPWQFAERRLVDLSTGTDAARRKVTIDTAGFAVRPPFPIMDVVPAQKMLWQGEVYEVLEVRTAPPAATEAQTWATSRLKAAQIEKDVASLYNRVLESGRLQYAPGYGPSAAQRRPDN